VRLTPKTIFFGILAVGLPFAVTVGWTLGTPVTSAAPRIDAPGGAGSLGTAPAPRGAAATAGPVAPVDYVAEPKQSPAAASIAPRAITPATTATTGLPTLSLSPLPPLTDPPVPTPTDISEPPSPSPTPSTEPSADPSSGGIGAGLIR
jgi:hypothetical protein